MIGIYQDMKVEIYEFDGLQYHIEPILPYRLKDLENCKKTKFVEYQGHMYATVPKKMYK